MAEELWFDSSRHLGAEVCTSLYVMSIVSQSAFVGKKNTDYLNIVSLTTAYVPSWSPVFRLTGYNIFVLNFTSFPQVFVLSPMNLTHRRQTRK
jgi:hypothetical protein